MEQQEMAVPRQPKRGVARKIFWLVVLLVVAIALVWWFRGGLTLSADYQAVFLDNNQVYFGKVSSGLNSAFITLTDVYYLQINQDLQPVSEDAPARPQFILVKLGLQEIHAPKDEMVINRDHIVFIEDLKDESQVVQGIRQFKEAQAQPQPQQ